MHSFGKVFNILVLSMPKCLAFPKPRKQNFSIQVNVEKKWKKESLVEGYSTDGCVSAEISKSPVFKGDGFVPFEDPGEGDSN